MSRSEARMEFCFWRAWEAIALHLAHEGPSRTRELVATVRHRFPFAGPHASEIHDMLLLCRAMRWIGRARNRYVLLRKGREVSR